MVCSDLCCGFVPVYWWNDFCYCIILDPAFQWLTDQATGFATILPEASQWVDIIIKFELGFGIGFEMPLVVFYLVMFGVVPYKNCVQVGVGYMWDCLFSLLW